MTPGEAILLALVFAGYVLLFYLLGRTRGFAVLAGTLLALLAHELIIRWLISLLRASPLIVTAVSLWKDGALIGLGLVWLQKLLHRMRAGQAPTPWRQLGTQGWLLLVLVAAGVASALMSPNRLAGVMAFRDYFEPVLVFVLVGAVWPEPQQMRRLVEVWLAVLAVMALLGMVQTLFWSAEDYVRWGFGGPSPEAGIPTVGLRGITQIRAPSTVTGPNELGMHMVLGLLAVNQLMLTSQRRRWLYLALGLLFGVMLVLTSSRSDLVAYFVGLAAIYWLRRVDRAAILGRWSFQNAAIVTAMLVTALLTGMFGRVTATATDPQEEYHVQDTSGALAVLLDHPAGVGMGLVGPRSGAFFPAETDYHVEGSIFQIAFDMGIWGAALWILFIGAALWQAYRGWRLAEDPLDRTLVGTAIGGWLGFGVVMLFLPLMQSMTLMAWMWFLLGYAAQVGHRPHPAGRAVPSRRPSPEGY